MNLIRSAAEVPVVRVGKQSRTEPVDFLASEEPLEIRIGFIQNGRSASRSISVTMRTPGSDFELAIGFLFSEGVVKNKSDIINICHCGRPDPNSGLNNAILIELASGVSIPFNQLERHITTNSSCGVCGKTSLQAVELSGCRLLPEDTLQISDLLLRKLPARLREKQSVFRQTGGLHASALIDKAGKLVDLQEDVGRHNALDKLIGRCLMREFLPIHDKLLLVSGRISFELVQKAIMAGAPIIAAIGAPSSLAVQLAVRYRMTLVGFLSEERFNIYSCPERIHLE